MQQPVEKRPAQRQHDPDIEQALAVIFEYLEEPGEHDRPQKHGAHQVQAWNARCRVQFGIQQHAIDDEPHEQRLDHLQSRHQHCEEKDDRDRIAVRPQPV